MQKKSGICRMDDVLISVIDKYKRLWIFLAQQLLNKEWFLNNLVFVKVNNFIGHAKSVQVFNMKQYVYQ